MDLLLLVADLKAGRNATAALKEVYARIREMLLKPLTARIEGRIKPRLDAEDVLHEAFLRALAGLPAKEFPSERAFVAWVYRIACNVILDQAKRRSAFVARLKFQKTGADSTQMQLPAQLREPSAEAAMDREDWIEVALSRLAPGDAEVIRLRWLLGRSFEEIAAAHQRTPVAVKRSYAKAWARFREIARRDAPSGS
jgi:RNA polymerase sigma factor (sigma-70 family)